MRCFAAFCNSPLLSLLLVVSGCAGPGGNGAAWEKLYSDGDVLLYPEGSLPSGGVAWVKNAPTARVVRVDDRDLGGDGRLTGPVVRFHIPAGVRRITIARAASPVSDRRSESPELEFVARLEKNEVYGFVVREVRGGGLDQWDARLVQLYTGKVIAEPLRPLPAAEPKVPVAAAAGCDAGA